MSYHWQQLQPDDFPRGRHLPPTEAGGQPIYIPPTPEEWVAYEAQVAQYQPPPPPAPLTREQLARVVQTISEAAFATKVATALRSHSTYRLRSVIAESRRDNWTVCASRGEVVRGGPLLIEVELILGDLSTPTYAMCKVPTVPTVFGDLRVPKECTGAAVRSALARAIELDQRVLLSVDGRSISWFQDWREWSEPL